MHVFLPGFLLWSDKERLRDRGREGITSRHEPCVPGMAWHVKRASVQCDQVASRAALPVALPPPPPSPVTSIGEGGRYEKSGGGCTLGR